MIRAVRGIVLCRWLFALAIVLAPALAFAGGSAAADALFREALAAAQAGDYAKAAKKFKASYDLEAAPGTLQGLALAEEKLGKLAAADAHYRELLDRATAKGDKKREKLAKDRMAAIEPHLAKITITAAASPPDGATISLDGTDLPLAALGSELPADPGAHVLIGSAPNGWAFEKKFNSSEGQKQFVTVEWKPPAETAAAEPSAEPQPVTPTKEADTAQPKAKKSSLRTIVLWVGGAGVVLAGVGTYFWLQSNKTYNDVNDRCPTGHCDPSLQSDVDNGKRDETLARVGLGLGGVALAAGVTLFVIGSGKKAEQSSARFEPILGPRSVGMRGRF